MTTSPLALRFDGSVFLISTQQHPLVDNKKQLM